MLFSRTYNRARSAMTFYLFIIVWGAGTWLLPRFCPGVSSLLDPSVYSCYSSSQSGSVSDVLDDPLSHKQALLCVQREWSDAIVTYRTTPVNAFERLARTRRTEFSRRAAFSNPQSFSRAIVQYYLSAATTHLLNTDIALSGALPLNLPTEQISFPFHSFW